MSMGGVKRKIIYLFRLNCKLILGPLAKLVSLSEREFWMKEASGPLSKRVPDGELIPAWFRFFMTTLRWGPRSASDHLGDTCKFSDHRY